MPLLNGRRWKPSATLPHGLQPTDELFVVRLTGECFLEYADYLKALESVKAPHWSCLCGNSNLTYEQAAKEEVQCRSFLEKFPAELHEPALRNIVHHSGLQIEDLVTAVQQAHRLSKSVSSGKENEPHEQGGSAPVTRQVIRCWINQVATHEKHASGKEFWVAYPEFGTRLQLSYEVTADFVASLPDPPKPVLKRSAEAGGRGRAQKRRRATSEGGSKPPTPKVAEPLPPAEPEATNGYAHDSDGYDQELLYEEEEYIMDFPATLEETERKFKPGTIKAIAVQVLKDVGPEGLSINQIMDIARERGLQDWKENAKRVVQFALSSDAAFARIRKGVYALRCLPGVVATNMPSKPAKLLKKRELEAELAEGEEGEDDGDMLDPLSRAERLVYRTQQTLADCHHRLPKAESALIEAQAKLHDAELKLRTPSKGGKRMSLEPEDIADMPSFEMTEEEKEYKGPEDDRKAIMQHRTWVKAQMEEREAAKEKWLQQVRQRKSGGKFGHNKEISSLQRSVRKLTEALEIAERNLVTAEKAAADAEKNLAKEQGRAVVWAARSKEREARDRVKEEEREEKDRRRRELAEQRRYPIDDIDHLHDKQLLAARQGVAGPVEDFQLPEAMSWEEGERLETTMYVADFLTQFGHLLGVRPLSFADLDRYLFDGCGYAPCQAALLAPPAPRDEKAGREERAEAREALYETYEALLAIILKDMKDQKTAGRLERRWGMMLGPATWPEVLRRYILTRAVPGAPRRGLVDEHVAMAAGMLGLEAADELTPVQHLCLLRYLCDETLDSEALRVLLSKRIEEADDVKRELRGGMAEERRRLKEILESEKEGRRARREAEQARKAEAAAHRRKDSGKDAGARDAAAAADAANGTADEAEGTDTPTAAAVQANGTGGEGKAGARSRGASPEVAEEEEEEEEEPSWELPEHLHEYSGDPDDRKALQKFQKAQQRELTKLDKAKAKWQADARRRAKHREAERKAAQEAQEQMQREKDEAQEALMKRQEAFEREMEQFSTRRQGLGMDRWHRRYWWGLANQRTAVFVSDFDGRVRALTHIAQLEHIYDLLDTKGQRECGLQSALEKNWDSIELALKRAAQAVEEGSRQHPPRERAAPLRQSSRVAGPPETYNPAKEAGRPQLATSRPNSADSMSSTPSVGTVGIENLAASAVVVEMTELQKAAAAAGVAAPPGGWKAWIAGIKATTKDALRAAAKEAAKEDGEEPQPEAKSTGKLAEASQAALKRRVFDMEEAVYAFAAGHHGDPPAVLIRRKGRWRRPKPQDGEEDAAADADAEEGDNDGDNEGDGDGDGENDNDDDSGQGDPATADRDASQEEAGFSAAQVLEHMEGSEDEKDAEGNKKKRVARLWRSLRERKMWKADLGTGVTATRIAYCTMVLAVNTYALMAGLEKEAARAARAAARRKTPAPPPPPVELLPTRTRKGSK